MLDQIKAIAEAEHLLAFLTTLLVFVIAFGLYWETTWSMVAQWTDNGNYSHGLLAIAAFVAVAWLFSSSRGRVPVRIVVTGMLLQVVIALLLLRADHEEIHDHENEDKGDESCDAFHGGCPSRSVARAAFVLCPAPVKSAARYWREGGSARRARSECPSPRQL